MPKSVAGKVAMCTYRILVLFAFRGRNNVAALASDGLGKLCRIPSGLRSVLASSHRARIIWISLVIEGIRRLVELGLRAKK